MTPKTTRKIALITGVSRLKGIGRAICVELAKKEFDLFFTYWTPYDKQMPWSVDDNEPSLIQEEIQKIGVRCEKMEVDLSKDSATETLLAAVNQKLGSPHVLINNATFSTNSTIKSLTGSTLDDHYKINIKATTLLTLAFINQFKYSQFGRIINITSGQSLGPMPDEIAYAITKGAMETFTKTIAQTIASKGITINAVNPGPNDTGWMDEKLQMQLLKRFPMKRLGTPKDTAKLIGFLTSEDGEWVTGQIIHSEGGFIR